MTRRPILALVAMVALTAAAPALRAEESMRVVPLTSNNQVVARGGEVIFQALATDDVGLTDVRATWYYTGGSLAYPMALTTTPNVYQARTTVSASAAPGWRSVEIEATDTKAHRTVTQRVNVYVQ